MWEIYIAIAIVSIVLALYFSKKTPWSSKTKKAYMELKDTDNFKYNYTPKEKAEPKAGSNGSAYSGHKSKFDGLFEYGRRENPDIDPEKQKQLREEIERIKQDEREARENKPDNRIGGFGTGYSKATFPSGKPETERQAAPQGFAQANTSFASLGTQNSFPSASRETSSYSGFSHTPTTPASTPGFNAAPKPQGSSFLGSIVDSALEAKTREQQTTGFSTGTEEQTPAGELPSTANPVQKKDEKKDKDWVPMGFFGK